MFLDIAAGFQILAKYAKHGMHTVLYGTDVDRLLTHLSAEGMSEDDQELMYEHGWHLAMDSKTWVFQL